MSSLRPSNRKTKKNPLRNSTSPFASPRPSRALSGADSMELLPAVPVVPEILSPILIPPEISSPTISTSVDLVYYGRWGYTEAGENGRSAG
jgi:hypothetical protein